MKGVDYEVRRDALGAVSVRVDDVWCSQQLLRADDEESLQMIVEIIVEKLGAKVRGARLSESKRKKAESESD